MTPKQAYYHALDVIKGRWAEGEDIIKNDPWSAYSYAKYIIKERWLEAEDIIKNNPEYAYLYALYIIKGRWKQAEDIIKNDPLPAYLYALNIIKGKLPENMHNAMICHAIKNPKHKCVKEYFDLINDKSRISNGNRRALAR